MKKNDKKGLVLNCRYNSCCCYYYQWTLPHLFNACVHSLHKTCFYPEASRSQAGHEKDSVPRPRVKAFVSHKPVL